MKKLFFLSAVLVLCFSFSVTAGEPETYGLQKLIRIGMENNPDLFAARLTVISYQEAVRSSKKMPNPTLELHTGWAESREAPMKVNTGGDRRQPVYRKSVSERRAYSGDEARLGVGTGRSASSEE